MKCILTCKACWDPFLCNLSGDVYAFYECVLLLMFLDGDTFSHGKHV